MSPTMSDSFLTLGCYDRDNGPPSLSLLSRRAHLIIYISLSSLSLSLSRLS